MTGNEIRRLVIERAHAVGAGHIGSSLSIADILAVLYDGALRGTSPTDPNRDRFVLSKGHAGLALYCALHLRGWMPLELLERYVVEPLLGTHPDHRLKGIEYSTGSLGMGVGYAVGAAKAAKMLGLPWRVVVLASDAECQEGAVWEAALFAAHHRLDNLTLIVDDNGQQAFGRVQEVLALGDLARKLMAFGFVTLAIDGHDAQEIGSALHYGHDASVACGAPVAIVAKTVAGKGVPFMEGSIPWHYRSLTDELRDEALAAIGG